MTASSDLTQALQGKILIPFIAPPNGGKGTQTSALLERFKGQLLRIDMGALLRAAAKDEANPLGQQICDAQNAGQLVSIDIVMDVLAEGMAKEVQASDHIKGFLLDGFPRNMEQLSRLDALCARVGAQLSVAIFLNVPDALIIERASGRIFHQDTHQPYNLNNPALQPPGYEASSFNLEDSSYYQREDDKPETVQKRLSSFYNETRPVIDALSEQGTLLEVDGARDAAVITQQLTSVIEQKLAELPSSCSV